MTISTPPNGLTVGACYEITAGFDSAGQPIVEWTVVRLDRVTPNGVTIGIDLRSGDEIEFWSTDAEEVPGPIEQHGGRPGDEVGPQWEEDGGYQPPWIPAKLGPFEVKQGWSRCGHAEYLSAYCAEPACPNYVNRHL